ncbi:MAG: hypothetical protein AAF629_03090, partial [Chloroflexota bacterium]
MLGLNHFEQDLNEAQQFLTQLQQEVAPLEGVLASGREVKLGEQSIRDLSRTKMRFGNPRASLTRLTPKLFEDLSLELTPLRRRQMRNQFDFYYMTLTLHAQLKSGINLSSVRCQLDLGPKGTDAEPIVEAYFPQRIWRDVLQFGGGMRLGLDGSLEFKADFDLDKLPQEIRAKLPAEITAKIDHQNAMHSFIVAPDFSFNLGRADIASAGEESSTCFWNFQNPELQETQSLQFVVLFKVPKGQRKIGLVGRALVTAEIGWLSAKIDHVLDHLSDGLLKWFDQRKDIPLGVEK